MSATLNAGAAARKRLIASVVPSEPGLRRGAAFAQARRDRRPISTTGLLVRGLGLSAILVSFSVGPVAAQGRVASPEGRSVLMTRPASEGRPVRADFERELASPQARYVADWVVDSGDHQKLPFVIVDKVHAKVFVFGADGRLRGAAPALLGLAVGDDSVPGIGDRPLSTIRPDERTTPAGRFVAALDRNLRGTEILWVDYDLAISLHRVITSKPKERRAQRLDTPSPLDNRISYGCINVPVKFYDTIVNPAFRGTNGIVYVLPETRSAREVFGAYDVDDHARQSESMQPIAAPELKPE